MHNSEGACEHTTATSSSRRKSDNQIVTRFDSSMSEQSASTVMISVKSAQESSHRKFLGKLFGRTGVTHKSFENFGEASRSHVIPRVNSQRYETQSDDYDAHALPSEYKRNYTTGNMENQRRPAADFLENAENQYENVDEVFYKGKHVDTALREYMMRQRLIGESSQVNAQLKVFSSEYHKQNPELFDLESLHILICSLVLLNTDMHINKTCKRMHLNDYARNLDGLYRGENFPIKLLTELFNSIKAKPLPLGPQQNPLPSVPQPAVPKRSIGYSISDLEKTEEFNNYKLSFSTYVSYRRTRRKGGNEVPFYKRSHKFGLIKMFGPYFVLLKTNLFNKLSQCEIFTTAHGHARQPNRAGATPFDIIVLMGNGTEFEITVIEKDKGVWQRSFNLSAAIFSVNPLPLSQGSSPILTEINFSSRISGLDLLDQYTSHVNKNEEYLKLFPVLVQYKPKPGEEAGLKASIKFVKRELEKYKTYKFVMTHASTNELRSLLYMRNAETIQKFVEFVRKLDDI